MKKIFTLISMALMAVGASAQTTIDFSGLKLKDFNYDETYYVDAQYEEKDENDQPTGKTYTSFTYKGGGTYSALELKDKNVKFNYKNSGEKASFFILADEYFTVGGKGAQLIISNLKKGQLVTLNVAAKADDSAPTFSPNGGALQGETPDMSKKNEFVNLTYQVTGTTGELTITESAKGFNIKSITIAEGGDITFEGNEFTVTFNGADAQTPDGYFDFGTSDNKHNFNSKFTDATWNGTEFTSGLKMEGSTLIHWTSTKTATVTIVQSTYNDKGIFMDDVKYEAATATAGTGCRIYTIENVAAGEHKIHRISGETNAGESGLFAVKVTYTGGGTAINAINAATIDANAPAYNLAGQKVDSSFKGIIIKNGKKMIQK